MPNKDLRKYNKGASSLPMKAEGEAPLFFHFFAHFLLRREILEEVKKNLYIFGGGGEFGKNPIEKEILEK
jgi:hypothetical protein